MSNDIIEKIYKVSEMAGGVNEVVIFTDHFKIFGSLVNDDKNNLKHLLTLKNASICSVRRENCSFQYSGISELRKLNTKKPRNGAFSIYFSFSASAHSEQSVG